MSGEGALVIFSVICSLASLTICILSIIIAVKSDAMDNLMVNNEHLEHVAQVAQDW